MNKNFNQKAFGLMNPVHDIVMSNNEQEILKHIEKNSYKVKEDDFKDVYPETEIARDKKYVENIKKKDGFVSNTDRAKIIEKSMAEQIELSGWLGDASTVETSEFDDISNGVDFVVEFDEREGESQRLAVDVTKNDEGSMPRKKAGKITDNLDYGKGSMIKYFKSDTAKGRIKNIPRVILAFDEKNYQNFVDLIYSYLKKNISKTDIAKEPFQLALIEEVLKQLESQKEYLESLEIKGVKETEIYVNIQKLIKKLEEALNEKKEDISEEMPSTGLNGLVDVHY